MHFTRLVLCTPFSASRQAQLCEKCDHILDFDENCGLYRYCWLYLYVLTLFPLHITRRMLDTPFSESRQAQLCPKCDNLYDFDENCALYPSCWRYFVVSSILPSHFTRRMICTPGSSSRQSDLYEKCDHILDSDDNLSAI